MTIRLSIIFLATLLFLVVLATLASPADAHADEPATERVSAVRVLSTGPLSIVVYQLSGR